MPIIANLRGNYSYGEDPVAKSQALVSNALQMMQAGQEYKQSQERHQANMELSALQAQGAQMNNLRIMEAMKATRKAQEQAQAGRSLQDKALSNGIKALEDTVMKSFAGSATWHGRPMSQTERQAQKKLERLGMYRQHWDKLSIEARNRILQDEAIEIDGLVADKQKDELRRRLEGHAQLLAEEGTDQGGGQNFGRIEMIEQLIEQDPQRADQLITQLDEAANYEMWRQATYTELSVWADQMLADTSAPGHGAAMKLRAQLERQLIPEDPKAWKDQFRATLSGMDERTAKVVGLRHEIWKDLKTANPGTEITAEMIDREYRAIMSPNSLGGAAGGVSEDAVVDFLESAFEGKEKELAEVQKKSQKQGAQREDSKNKAHSGIQRTVDAIDQGGGIPAPTKWSNPQQLPGSRKFIDSGSDPRYRGLKRD